MASKRQATHTLTVTNTERRILRAALLDHLHSLESNKRRAIRGHALACDQEDDASASAFEDARARILERIASVRTFMKAVR